MDMSTRSELPHTEPVYIGNIGFMFEVNHDLKYNLISPDVLAFFDGVQESEEIAEDCAFPLPIYNTNLRQSIFQNMGQEWAVCSDGIFRKCQVIQCNVEYGTITKSIVFHIDKALFDRDITGIISF